LVQLRAETEVLYQNIEDDLSSSYRQYDKTAQTVDAVATIANILADLSSLAVKGMKSINLSGAALEEANKDIAKDGIKSAVGPLKDAGIKISADAIHPDSGRLWSLGKALLQSYLDIQSPAFWASVIGNLKSGASWSAAVTTRQEDITQQAKEQVQRQRDIALRALDQRIEQLQSVLNGSSLVGTHPLP
jgi:hypothetical protein